MEYNLVRVSLDYYFSGTENSQLLFMDLYLKHDVQVDCFTVVDFSNTNCTYNVLAVIIVYYDVI